MNKIQKQILKFIFGFLLISLIFVNTFILLKDNKAVTSNVKAASVVTENFTDGSGLSVQNGTAVTAGNLAIGDEGVTLSENFDSYADGNVPTNWTRETTDWSVIGQQYVHSTNAYDDSRTFFNQNLKNGEFQADVSMLGGEHLAGLIFRAVDNQNYYIVSLSSTYDFISISKVVGGVTTALQTINENYDPSTFYEIKVKFNNTNIKVSVNGVSKFDVFDSTYTNAGLLGFWRNGAGMAVEDVIVGSIAYDSASTDSITYSQSQNIQSVLLVQTGVNTPKTSVFVSNDNGVNWLEIKNSSQVFFKQNGLDFKFRVYLLTDTTSPTIDSLAFTLNDGNYSSSATTMLPDLTHLHYDSTGNSLATASFNPNNISLTSTLADMKVVQQTAIVYRNGKTIAYLPNSYDNRLTAYNLTDNLNLWTTVLTDFVESTPYIDNGVIYIGDYSPTFYALDQDTGNILWTYTPNDTISGGNIDSNSSLVFFSDYGYGGTTRLYAVNKTTHNLVWSYSVALTTFISFSLDKANDIIYVSSDDTVSAFNASTGSLIWRNVIGKGYITKQPVIAEDKLVVGADQALVVLNRFDGTTVWDEDYVGAEQGVGGSPAVWKNYVYYSTKDDQTIYARSLDNGSLLWFNTLTSGTFSSPVITQDGFMYLSYNDGVRATDTTNADSLWTSPQNSWNENIVSIAHGYMLFTNPAGNGTLNIYKTNEETYVSTDAITANRDDREIVNIQLDSSQSSNFTCTASQLTVNGSGTVKLNYGSLKAGTSKPASMIINELTPNSIRVCDQAVQSSFIYDFGGGSMTDIMRDGVIIPRSSWTRNGSLITILDNNGAHNYQTAFISPTPTASSTQTVTPTNILTTTPSITDSPIPTDIVEPTQTISPTVSNTVAPSIEPSVTNPIEENTVPKSWNISFPFFIEIRGLNTAFINLFPDSLKGFATELSLYGFITSLLLLLLMLIPIILIVRDERFSQVINNFTKEGLFWARVTLYDLENNTVFKTLRTDNYGKFAVKLPKNNYRIEIRKLGFEGITSEMQIPSEEYLAKEFPIEEIEEQSLGYKLQFAIYDLNPKQVVFTLAFLFAVVNVLYITNIFSFVLVLIIAAIIVYPKLMEIRKDQY